MKKKSNFPGLKKSLGQIFLKNELIAHTIASLLTPKNENSLIFEIGPGSGILTKKIIESHPKNRVISIEKDHYWATTLKKNFQSVEIIENDFLDFKPIKSTYPWYFIGNIPYNITYPIIEKIILSHQDTEQAVFMIQKEVAEKLAKNKGKNYGPLSVLLQTFFTVELHDIVSPKEFSNPPKVFSQIIRLNKIANPDIKNEKISSFKNFLKIIFHFPRKKIKNNCSTTFLEKFPLLKDLLNLRAQEIVPKKLIEIFLKNKEDE